MPRRQTPEQYLAERRRDAAATRRPSSGSERLDTARAEVDRLDDEHAQALQAAQDRVAELRAANGGQLPNSVETVTKIAELYRQADAIEAELDEARQTRTELLEDHVRHTSRSRGTTPQLWAADAAGIISDLTPTAGITSGSIDTPSLVEPNIVIDPRDATRIIDLLVNRRPLDGNSFEYLRQTVRTNNADVVADSALKPTSTFTVESREDRARVVAHLSEPVPVRLFDDHEELEGWLADELANGVLDALEAQAVNGDGLGENMTGLLNTTGITLVAFDTDPFRTARRARSIMQDLKERPTAWVLSIDDAETFDLERDANGQFIAPNDDRIFGPHPIVVSNTLTAGTALLADWRLARLYVREGTRVQIDAGGPLFDTNEAKLRGEGRFGVAYLRPQAFASIDLVGP